MKFGNWNITETGLELKRSTNNSFVIGKQQLLETEKIEGLHESFYKWLLLATEEEWLSEDDLYDLNFAFVYAAGKWQQDFDYALFDRTVEYQFEMLDEDEDEDE